MNRRTLGFTSLVTAASLVLMFLATPVATAQATPAKVTIGVDSFVLGAQAWVAQDLGLFKKYGINANIRTFSTGVGTLDAVLTGQTDIGFGIDFAVLTRMSSKHLRVISECMNPDPGFHKLAVWSGITGAKDLAGKSMGVAQGTAQQYVTYKYLEVNGIPASSVKLENMGDLFNIISALRSHRIDAAWVWGNGVDQAKAINGVSILTNDSAAKVNYVGYIVSSPGFAQDHTDTAANLLKALSDATDWMNNNMQQAADIVAKNIHAKPDAVLAAMKGENYVIELKRANLDSMSELGNFMVQHGIIKEKLNPLDYVDSAPLKKALPGKVQE